MTTSWRWDIFSALNGPTLTLLSAALSSSSVSSKKRPWLETAPPSCTTSMFFLPLCCPLLVALWFLSRCFGVLVFSFFGLDLENLKMLNYIWFVLGVYALQGWGGKEKAIKCRELGLHASTENLQAASVRSSSRPSKFSQKQHKQHSHNSKSRTGSSLACRPLWLWLIELSSFIFLTLSPFCFSVFYFLPANYWLQIKKNNCEDAVKSFFFFFFPSVSFTNIWQDV